MKKLFALLLATLMIVALGITAFAADPTYSIKITNTEAGHTYKAYQIFTGDLNTDGDTLSDIVWGNGVNSSALLTALQADETIGSAFSALTAETGTAAAIAKIVGGAATESDFAKTFASIAAENVVTANGVASTAGTGEYNITGLDRGYYIVVDSLGTGAAADTALSRYFLQVVADVVVAPKSNKVPTDDKKIGELNTETGAITGVYGSAKYAVGDTVPYVLSATLPEAATYGAYKAYKLVFEDTLSTGLTAPAASTIKVYNGTTDITSLVNIDVTGQKITVTIADTKAAGLAIPAGATVSVVYGAVVNNSAVTSSAGNPNELVLKFSHDPNTDDGSELGELPPVITKVYLAEITVNKAYEGTTDDLGAGFTLYRVTSEGNVAVGSEKTTADHKVSWSQLEDGTYVLKETTKPDGYNQMADMTFTIDSTIVGSNRTAITADGFTAVLTSETDSTPTGELQTSVTNYQGATLPETGGVGTALLIIGGCVLFIGTAIVLVTKKRMYNEGN